MFSRCKEHGSYFFVEDRPYNGQSTVFYYSGTVSEYTLKFRKRGTTVYGERDCKRTGFLQYTGTDYSNLFFTY